MLMSATSICECEHSQLYVSLISARQGRATPFKKRKSPPLEEEKRLKPEKNHPGPDSFKEMKGDKERSQTWLRLKLGLTINANGRNRKMGAYESSLNSRLNMVRMEHRRWRLRFMLSSRDSSLM